MGEERQSSQRKLIRGCIGAFMLRGTPDWIFQLYIASPRWGFTTNQFTPVKLQNDLWTLPDAPSGIAAKFSDPWQRGSDSTAGYGYSGIRGARGLYV